MGDIFACFHSLTLYPDLKKAFIKAVNEGDRELAQFLSITTGRLSGPVAFDVSRVERSSHRKQ